MGYLRHAYIAQPRTIYREASEACPRACSDPAARSARVFEMLSGICEVSRLRVSGATILRLTPTKLPSDWTRCCVIRSSCG